MMKQLNGFEVITKKRRPSNPKKGWGFPWNSKKAHYFREGRSLCGKWGYFGALHDDESYPDIRCQACAKKLTAFTKR